MAPGGLTVDPGVPSVDDLDAIGLLAYDGVEGVTIAAADDGPDGVADHGRNRWPWQTNPRRRYR